MVPVGEEFRNGLITWFWFRDADVAGTAYSALAWQSPLLSRQTILDFQSFPVVLPCFLHSHGAACRVWVARGPACCPPVCAQLACPPGSVCGFAFEFIHFRRTFFGTSLFTPFPSWTFQSHFCVKIPTFLLINKFLFSLTSTSPVLLLIFRSSCP